MEAQRQRGSCGRSHQVTPVLTALISPRHGAPVSSRQAHLSLAARRVFLKIKRTIKLSVTLIRYLVLLWRLRVQDLKRKRACSCLCLQFVDYTCTYSSGLYCSVIFDLFRHGVVVLLFVYFSGENWNLEKGRGYFFSQRSCWRAAGGTLVSLNSDHVHYRIAITWRPESSACLSGLCIQVQFCILITQSFTGVWTWLTHVEGGVIECSLTLIYFLMCVL